MAEEEEEEEEEEIDLIHRSFEDEKAPTPLTKRRVKALKNSNLFMIFTQLYCTVLCKSLS